MDKLKPCPFCASEHIELQYKIVGGGYSARHTEHYGYCWNCGATGPNGMSVEDGTRLWNLRREKKPESLAEYEARQIVHESHSDEGDDGSAAAEEQARFDAGQEADKQAAYDASCANEDLPFCDGPEGE